MEDDAELDGMGEEPEVKLINAVIARESDRKQKRNADAGRFLGDGRKVDVSVIEPRYYGELLAWALNRHVEVDGWKIVKTVGYRDPRAVYIDVNTGPGEYQNVLRDGTLLVDKGADRLAVTINANLRGYNSVLVTGLTSAKRKAEQFADGIRSIVRTQNFYRGQKLELSQRIRFLNLPVRSWESVVLDTGMKDEIRANTTGFLANREYFASLGIPARRGVLFAGEPGTGKTLVCKALMAESPGVSCILAHTHDCDIEEHIKELYDLAQDLAPTVVFIEDLDIIAQDRTDYGYTRGTALQSLLSALDGVEEHHEIVTVATTNCLEVIDKAISQRPSRFDRVIQLPRPSLELRRQLVSALCQRIPLDEGVQSYVARKTENLTPAQIQEVVYSLVIGWRQRNGDDETRIMFGREDVDDAVSKISRTNRRQLGFAIGDNHFGELSPAAIGIGKEIEADGG